MVSFSLFSFSYPQNLRESLPDAPAVTTDEKADFLRSKCRETLLTEGARHVDQIKELILNAKTGNYLVLYCKCGDDFIFSSNKKITETLLCQKEKDKVVFRIFSRRELQLPEILFYLIYRELDINGIRPRGRNF